MVCEVLTSAILVSYSVFLASHIPAVKFLFFSCWSVSCLEGQREGLRPPQQFPLRRVQQREPGPLYSEVGTSSSPPPLHVEFGNSKVWKQKARRLLPGYSFARWRGNAGEGGGGKGSRKFQEGKRKKKRHHTFFWIAERKELMQSLAQHHGDPNTSLFLLVSISQPWVLTNQFGSVTDSQPPISWFLSSSWFSSVPEDEQEL